MNVKSSVDQIIIFVVFTISNYQRIVNKSQFCPGWCGSVDWVLACEPKGCWFDFCSGHLPALWARSPVGGVQEATTHWCFSPFLSPSLPLSLKINKIFKIYKNKVVRMYKALKMVPGICGKELVNDFIYFILFGR